MKPGIFLDRDGTLIEDPGYLGDPAGVRLLPGVREAMEWLHGRCLLFLFSNQSGIGRGWLTRADAKAVNARMESLLGLPPPVFTAVCMPPEPPGTPSAYRKPSPRFILESMARYHLDPATCWMIGDKTSDVEAGRSAGIRAVRIGTAAANPAPTQDAVVADLRSFVRMLRTTFERIHPNEPQGETHDPGIHGSRTATPDGIPGLHPRL